MAVIKKQLAGGANAPTLELHIEPQAYDVETNTTPVAYSLQLVRPSAIQSGTEKAWSVKIGSKAFTGTTSINGSGTKTIDSGNVAVIHNADGTKIINCSFSVAMDITWSGTYNGTISNSGNVTLPTIPRATPIEIPSEAELGTGVTIKLPRASSRFTHSIKITLGNYSEVIATGVGVSYTWSIPLTLANQITESTSKTCKVTATTYDGTNIVGSKTANIKLQVPASIKPTIKSISVTDASVIKAGVYVKGNSKVKVTISTTEAYGSKIADITTTLDGVTYKGNFTSEILKTSGSLTMTTEIIDNRGRKTTKTTTINVVSYSKPRVATFKVNRCNSSGQAQDDGTSLKITYNFTIDSLSGYNTRSAKIGYRTTSGIANLKTIDAYSESSSFITSSQFDANSTYELVIELEDLYSRATKTTYAETIKVTYSIQASGNGMALGKVAETEGTLDINYDVVYRKKMRHITDVDWTDITLDPAFKKYAEDEPCKYRVTNGIVEITGAVSPLTAFTSTNDRVVFATIPREYAPKQIFNTLCQGSGKRTWLHSMKINGEMTISRYGLTTNESVPTNAWLTFHITYTI